LCANCSHTIKGNVYCQDCLVQGAELARLAVAAGPDLVNPKRAALFAVVPGMGAVYNRQYNKALAHFAMFAVLITLADHGPDVFGFAAFSFWVFSIIDAYRSAQEILRRRLSETPVEPIEKPLNAPIWGAALIVLGCLFFIKNLNWVSFDFVGRFWPLAFVFLGLYLIYDHYQKQKTAPPIQTHQSNAPTRPKEL
jgi:hypothetical protein